MNQYSTEHSETQYDQDTYEQGIYDILDSLIPNWNGEDDLNSLFY